MTDNGTVGVHIVPMITRMIFEWTFDYHMMFPLLHDTLQNPRCVGILLSHTNAHYIVILLLPILFFFFVDMFWHPRDIVTYVWPYNNGCRHTERALRISPSLEHQIPLLSNLVPYQTFRWTCKLSLWSPSYRWCLSNPKVHHTVGSDYNTLMV